MELLHYICFFFVALAVLIAFHEAGHFFVARSVGVHVVRFSIGFGRPLARWRDKYGTEFCLAWIPLGGYVRMFDRRDADAASLEAEGSASAKRSYDQLDHKWRVLILLGGPAANFLLAAICYWFIAVIGSTVTVPIVASVEAGSVASVAGLRAGDEILRVDGRATPSWGDVGLALAARLGESGTIDLDIGHDAGERTYRLPIENWLRGAADPDPVAALGIHTAQAAVIGGLLPGEPGARAGLRAGDRVTRVNGEATPLWSDFVRHVRANPGTPLRVTAQRGSATVELDLTPRHSDGGDHGYVGIRKLQLSDAMREVRFGPFAALRRAGAETWAGTALTVGLIGKMLTLDVSPRNLAGPITIAKVAGDSARLGVTRFLSLLALLSISLGVINLLPIPILDGGQVVSTVVEMVRGKPLSETVEATGARIGIAMVAGLMVLAFYSDVTRWFWPG